MQKRNDIAGTTNLDEKRQGSNYGGHSNFCHPYDTGYKSSFKRINDHLFAFTGMTALLRLQLRERFHFYATFIPRLYRKLTFFILLTENNTPSRNEHLTVLILVIHLKNIVIFKEQRMRTN
ncbi:hypothetical protein [Edaphovirga cremea]|uniref:hypothetical protein n=1 Tax=Edaphovirga cremea TaxID=2267246 RepID=UPI0013002A89|nr:hypothetical protein [Edaphovirga cremea]